MKLVKIDEAQFRLLGSVGVNMTTSNEHGLPSFVHHQSSTMIREFVGYGAVIAKQSITIIVISSFRISIECACNGFPSFVHQGVCWICAFQVCVHEILVVSMKP